MSGPENEVPIAETLAVYDAHAERLAARYVKNDPERFFLWHRDLLPEPPGPVLDIGAGTGILADAFARRGYRTVATEPSSGMAEQAQKLFPNPDVRFFDAALPDLTAIRETEGPFQVIVMDGVWMHIPPSIRPACWRSLAEIAGPGAILSMAVRYGPSPPERRMHVIDLDAMVSEAAAHGFDLAKRSEPRPTDLNDGSGFVRVCFRKR